MSTEVLNLRAYQTRVRWRRAARPGGLRGFLDLGRFDVIAVVVLVLVAFGLRFASPIFPNFLSGGGTVSALGVGLPHHRRIERRVHARCPSGRPVWSAG